MLYFVDSAELRAVNCYETLQKLFQINESLTSDTHHNIYYWHM